MAKFEYPKAVPILSAKDFCRGRLHGPNDTHCLLGHALQSGLCVAAVTPIPPVAVSRTILAAARSFKEEGKLDVHLPTGPLPQDVLPFRITCVNDSTAVQKRMLARIWNRAMAMLGYTEGNPEAKYV